MKRVILIAALTLSACAHRPVAVPCVAKDQAIPQEPEQVGDKLTGQADRDFQIVAGSAAKLRVWGRSLQGIVEACRG